MNNEIFLHVRLRDIRNFFAKPEIDFFDGEAFSLSGIEQIIYGFRSDRQWRKKEIHATIALPSLMADADLIERVPDALSKYCDKHIKYAQRRLQETLANGRRALAIGVVFLAFCIAISMIAETVLGGDALFGRLLMEGPVIAGWVGFWRPIELLLFEWWPDYQEIKLYRKLRSMKLDIVEGS